ncbi:MAG: tRNA uridine-5-carboxymethylaminomethyl(34) synthesis GTPase MnmE [Blastocatellia bacterium]|nr:tRNA uridine-5-carboxymethylaminomethyl(34) synthesis GTPase MnmE [Blastocatellia bacterium]
MAATIVALATPQGRSGIGVIRLSGDDSVKIAAALIGLNEPDLTPRQASLYNLKDPVTGETLDSALVTYFRAPNSFTGEDVVEISCHGSPVILREVVDVCLAEGARLAEPGEFSLRALGNGRINLAEAEAIRDLIDSQTAAAARQAVRQMHGEFSARLQPITDALLDIIVILESALEFVEDDLPEAQADKVRAGMVGVSDAIRRISATFKAGKLIREGISVALVGRPNVGKSSLFNYLLGSDRAIVTEIAGTTRDQLRERLVVNDIPISLIDTAGLRETVDTVESIGVERSRKTMADADIVVVIVDASVDLENEDIEIIRSVKDVTHLIVANKMDIAPVDATRKIGALIGELTKSELILISAKTGHSVDLLKRNLIAPFSPGEAPSTGFLVSDARHYNLLVRASAEIENSIELLDTRASEELTLIGLHNALRYLGQITGESTTEDMLTRIFSTFCIGK